MARIDSKVDDDGHVDFKVDVSTFVIESSNMGDTLVQRWNIFPGVTRPVCGVFLSMSQHSNL